MSLVNDFADDNPPKEGKKTVLFFGAKWHEGCVTLDGVLSSLAQQQPHHVECGRIDVDESPKLAEQYAVDTVPSFVFLNATGFIVETVVGGEDVAQVTEACKRLVNEESTAFVILNQWSRYVGLSG